MLRGISVYPTGIERFLSESPTVRSPDTREAYSRVLQSFQARYPRKRLSEFKAEDVVGYLLFDALGRSRHWSPNTLATYRTALVSFFEWAIEYGYVIEPVSVVVKRRVRVESTNALRPHVWLTEAEVRAMLASCEPDARGQRDRALLALGLLCGLRLEEMRLLPWSGVNVEARTIALVGKGAKPAYVGLSSELGEFLSRWARICTEESWREIVGQPVLPRGWNVGGPGTGTTSEYRMNWSKPMSRSALEGIVRARGSLIGRPDLAPHDLRRSCAGLLEARGVSIQDISRFLRHSNVAVTQRYLSESPYKVIETAAVLAGLG